MWYEVRCGYLLIRNTEFFPIHFSCPKSVYFIQSFSILILSADLNSRLCRSFSAFKKQPKNFGKNQKEQHL